MSQEKYELKVNEKNQYTFHLPDKKFIQFNGEKTGLFTNPKPQLALYSEAKLLGEGNYGKVYEACSYAIDYRLKKLTYKNEDIVIKVILLGAIDRDSIEEEYSLVKDITRIGMKAPVFTVDPNSNKTTCYSVMKRLPGKPLNELDIKSLSIDKRLELTYKLLRALRAQVTNCGIVHRDIKPENILIVLEPEIRVNIIDYGLAKKAGNEEDESIAGTPIYSAPEIFRVQPHDVACDVYSLAKTIAILWIENDELYKEMSMEQAADYAERCASLLPNYLIQQTPAALRNLLQDMLHAEQNKRISIHKAIAKFESAFPEQKIIAYSRLELKRLNSYSNEIRTKHSNDAETIDKFTEKMNQILSSGKDILSIKKECSDLLLGDQGIRECAKKHKRVEYIIKNITITICSLGISCIAAYISNRKLGFFQNPVSEVLNNIEKDLNTSIAPAA